MSHTRKKLPGIGGLQPSINFILYMLPGLFSDIKQSIVHLFYPHLCEGCNKPLVGGEELLCISCTLELPETNYHHTENNETALRFAGRVPFIKATTYAWFTNEGLLQHLIHGLKYGKKKRNGIYLGKRLGTQLKKINWASDIDFIVPVPLHRSKETKRGYNQSLLIAHGLSESLHIPVATNVLERVRETESQTKKSRAERVNNMTDAFKINNNSMFRQKHLLLCDDVLTTGATLEACALALAADESIKISIATIGIAVS